MLAEFLHVAATVIICQQLHLWQHRIICQKLYGRRAARVHLEMAGELSLGQLVWVTPPQVTNYPKFLRQIELCGRSDITHMVERQVDFPEDLQDFFDKNPEVRGLHFL